MNKTFRSFVSEVLPNFLLLINANTKDENLSLLIKELCWELLANNVAFVCSGLKV